MDPHCPSCGVEIERCRDVSFDPMDSTETGVARPCGHEVVLSEVGM